MKKRIIGIVLIVLVMVFAFASCGSSKYEEAVDLFQSGDFSQAVELFEAMREGKYAEESKKYLSAIKYLEKSKGTWSNEFLFNENTDWRYYGEQWRTGKVEVEIGAPYSLTSALASDGDWRVEATVKIKATFNVLTGGDGGDVFVKSFNFNGKGGVDHISSDSVNAFTGYFDIINEEGKCLFTPRYGQKSIISIDFKADKADLYEIPYSLDWSESYLSYGEYIELNKK